ncbi:Uncharacterised protein [Vibrio cholerae]|nr:Uncharacterised protein [Vibrio cholerae]
MPLAPGIFKSSNSRSGSDSLLSRVSKASSESASSKFAPLIAMCTD